MTHAPNTPHLVGTALSGQCEECGDELEDNGHLVECFEESGKVMCESCWEEWLGEKESEHDDC